MIRDTPGHRPPQRARHELRRARPRGPSASPSRWPRCWPSCRRRWRWPTWPSSSRPGSLPRILTGPWACWRTWPWPSATVIASRRTRAWMGSAPAPAWGPPIAALLGTRRATDLADICRRLGLTYHLDDRTPAGWLANRGLLATVSVLHRRAVEGDTRAGDGEGGSRGPTATKSAPAVRPPPPLQCGHRRPRGPHNHR